MSRDAIGVVEAAYDLEAEPRTWLTQLLAAAAPRLDRGLGVIAWFVSEDGSADRSTIVTQDMSSGILEGLGRNAEADRALERRLNQPAPFASSAQRTAGSQRALARHAKLFERHMHPLGVRAFDAFVVGDPSGPHAGFGAPSPNARRPAGSERRYWDCVAAHIAAAARLRRLPSSPPEAVLRVSGALEHAEPAAFARTARETLRAAVRDIDRARCRARRQDDNALSLWRGLVAGRWSLVERFDDDGRRYFVARRNDPDVSAPLALTRRERQVIAYAAMGHSLKLIAYELGLSVSTVAEHRTTAMRKLRVRSVAELTGLRVATDSRRSVPPLSSSE
jgi:DNA-binding CsgD family transcriptional regulator